MRDSKSISPEEKVHHFRVKNLGFSQVLEPVKWQDLLEGGKNGCNAFQTSGKIHFSEKNILGLGAL